MNKITPIYYKIVLFLVAVTFNISCNYTIDQRVKHQHRMTDMTGNVTSRFSYSSSEIWGKSIMKV